jgi:hypothetical protein
MWAPFKEAHYSWRRFVRQRAAVAGHNRSILGVMPGHSRLKDGVLSHAYDPGIHDEWQH